MISDQFNIPSGPVLGVHLTFVDSTTGVTLGSTTLAAGSATFNLPALPPGSQVIVAFYGGDRSFLPSSTSTGVTVNVVRADYILSATASGALSLSGTTVLSTPGTVYVNSSSSQAVTLSGSSKITAGGVRIVGGYTTSGTSTVSPKPVTNIAPIADPLAGLAVPAAGTSLGSVNLGGSSTLTINPGVYTSISVSGAAVLTMNPGVYEIAGGGVTFTTGAVVKGSGVTIYNAGASFPSAGEKFGAITFSGSASVQLTAPTTGPYAGILIFQSRDNTQTISLTNSATLAPNAVIYAAAGALALSGSTTIGQSTLVVSQLSFTNSTSSTLTDSSSAASQSETAGHLLAHNLTVYVDDTSRPFTAAEQARIADAIATVDAVVEPYGVKVTLGRARRPGPGEPGDHDERDDRRGRGRRRRARRRDPRRDHTGLRLELVRRRQSDGSRGRSVRLRNDRHSRARPRLGPGT